MTAAQLDRYDYDQIDEHYRNVVDIVGHDWLKGEDHLAKMVGVMFACRRGPDDEISLNDVRRHLTEDTVKGPRVSIEPHHYSALWKRARAMGFIAKQRDKSGRVLYEATTTSTTGNNGKPQPLYV